MNVKSSHIFDAKQNSFSQPIPLRTIILELANTVTKMSIMNVDILGLSKVSRPSSGKQKIKEGYIYYSERTDSEHQYGTAILISDRIIAQAIIQTSSL